MNKYPNVPLGQICNIEIGRTPSRNQPKYWGNGYSWLSIADMKNLKFLSDTKEQVTDLAIEECNMKLVPQGTLLFSFKLSVGKVGIASKDLYTNEAIAALKIKSEKEVYQPFLYHSLGSLNFDGKGDRAVKGITLNKAKLRELLIPLPPHPEQKRIAEILDKADALRQKNKQLLAAYDELLQATFLDMFGDPATNPKGWKEVMLDSTIQKIQIGPFGSQLHKSDYLESGIPLINPTNIKENRILFDDAACISEEKYDSMPQYHLFDGDVVMARRGDLSKVALVKQNGGKMFCGTGSLYVRFSDELNKFFLFKILAHEKTINFLEKEARGVTMPNLNKSIIKRIPIFLPPITLQNQFAQIVENIDAQKTLVKQSLQESEDLFNGLVQKAFGGEL